MGAVQRLALVVIIGLTALATLLVIYLADEPNRREVEAQEQTEASLERAMATYTQYCVSCHGPGGRGYLESGRVGWPLAGTYIGPEDPNYKEGQDEQSPTERNQSTDPAQWAKREQIISTAIHQGRGGIMPAWGADYGGELNDEQIRELVLLIHEGDWNAVYNHVVEADDGYPTVPVAGGGNVAGEATTASGEPAPTLAPGGETAATPAVAGSPGATTVDLEAYDIGWTQKELTVAKGGSITMTNIGSGPHNFAIDGYQNDEVLQDIPVGGEPVTWQVPDDLAPGTYTFYCEIPGHRAAGMEGTLTITG